MQLSGRTIAFGIAGVACLLVLQLWPRREASPEDQIRALVAHLVRAAEDRQLGEITEAMAEDFKGPSNASRDEVKSIIAYQVLRSSQTVAVFNPELTVTADELGGTISGKFVFARGKAKSVEALPAGGVISAYQIDAKLEKRDGKWRFASATYRQL